MIDHQFTILSSPSVAITLDRQSRGAPGDGTTLLHLASGVGLFDLAVRVLERRADVALEHRYFGAPLLLAAEQGPAITRHHQPSADWESTWDHVPMTISWFDYI